MRDAVDVILDQWAGERPDLDAAPMGVIGRVLRLNALLNKELAKNFSRFELTSWEFDVLATLRRSGPPFVLAVGGMMSSMLISSGTMTHRLDRLEARGLVGREPDPGDRRGVLVRLAPEGLRLVNEVLEAHLADERRLLAGLAKDRQDQLAGLLRELLVHLGDQAPAES